MAFAVLMTFILLLRGDVGDATTQPTARAASQPHRADSAPGRDLALARSWEEFEPNLELPSHEATRGTSQPATPIKRPEVDARPVSRDKTQPSAASSNSWVRTLGSLAAVVGLICLLAWGYRVVAERGLGFATARAKQPGLIDVLSRAALSPRHTVTLLRIGPRLVLVGYTRDRIARIDAFDDPELAARLAGQSAGAGASGPGLSDAFRNNLEGAQRELAEAEAELEEADSPDDARLAELREALTTATQRLRAMRERI